MFTFSLIVLVIVGLLLLMTFAGMGAKPTNTKIFCPYCGRRVGSAKECPYCGEKVA